ncbi:MAG: replicative DNA helicase [Solirubrobacteraceae bacterium]
MSATTLLPPHNLDAERSVLGAILLTASLALEPIALEDRLAPGHFYREQHALVYEAMLALHRSREPVDTLTVANQLAQHGTLDRAGGSDAVDELAGWVPAAGHARAYARIVRDHATRRQLLRACYQIQQQALEGHGDVDGLLADASKRVGDLLEQALAAGVGPMHEVLFDDAAELHDLAKQPEAMIRLATGIPRLDEALKGMRPGELIILAARPSQGKSVLGQQIATHNALAGHGTILFSLEMSRQELADRHFAARARVPFGKIRAAALHDRDLDRITTEAVTWAKSTPPLMICDRAPLTVAELRAEALRCRRQLPGGLRLLVVDYLQLLSPATEGRHTNRYEQVSEISRSLKTLAKELAVPVLAIAQLSRETERRPDKRPQLSDLRDSGALEQDANTVLLLYRADRYDERVEPGRTEVIIAKARNAECATVELEFEGAYQRFRSRV